MDYYGQLLDPTVLVP